MPFQSQLPLDNYRAKLLKTKAYITRTGFTSDYHWKDVARDRYIIKGTKGPHSIAPAEITIIGQLSYKAPELSTVGNFHPLSEKSTMEKAKWVFHLELPEDNGFAHDYITAVDVLRQMQKSGGKDRVSKYMLEDPQDDAEIQFVTDLFKTRKRGAADQSHGVGRVQDDPGRVNPNNFEDVLPSSIVEVKFSVHVWSFKDENQTCEEGGLPAKRAKLTVGENGSNKSTVGVEHDLEETAIE
ncbi:hypothetical protein BDN71DRAFT_1428247 [Pleurotus eryngii]|uniref:Uncharacterized protein n=1 Tax=Pleurotus eryngii TaxID=5323 RepID=A0A9P6DAF0_PLEER|nr:hypothetical protein BDN71DRAFT_1428247 [Pleurotus eryngii]